LGYAKLPDYAPCRTFLQLDSAQQGWRRFAGKETRRCLRRFKKGLLGVTAGIVSWAGARWLALEIGVTDKGTKGEADKTGVAMMEGLVAPAGV
jgi:hypothetical protein